MCVTSFIIAVTLVTVNNEIVSFVFATYYQQQVGMHFRNVRCLVEVNVYSVTFMLNVGKPCGLFVRHHKKIMSYVVLFFFIYGSVFDISYVNKGWHLTCL